MAILKKASKCANCGQAIPAGAEICWKQVSTDHRHGGNGTVLRTSRGWVPAHASLLQCELGVNSRAEVVAVFQDRVEKLRRQADRTAKEGDDEMTEFAYKQVLHAEQDLANL